MTFGEKLKQARADAGLKQSELARLIGTTNTTISNWEKGVSKPDLDMLSYICGALQVTVSYFLQPILPDDEVTIPEFNMIKKYRKLDNNGKSHVDTVLDWETQRMELYKQALAEREQQKPQIVEIEKAAPPRYSIIYYQRLASAGTGEYLFNDIPTDIIEVLDTPIARRADFALGVNGNSMEPTCYDGDKVYVEITDEIPTGSIGIFTRGNECLIKELGTDRLISHNKEYGDIPAREDIKLVGLVLGKVAEV